MKESVRSGRDSSLPDFACRPAIQKRIARPRSSIRTNRQPAAPLLGSEAAVARGTVGGAVVFGMARRVGKDFTGMKGGTARTGTRTHRGKNLDVFHLVGPPLVWNIYSIPNKIVKCFTIKFNFVHMSNKIMAQLSHYFMYQKNLV